MPLTGRCDWDYALRCQCSPMGLTHRCGFLNWAPTVESGGIWVPAISPLRNGKSPWKQQPTATGTRFSAIIWPSSRSRTQTATQCWPPASTGESLLEVPRKPRSSRSRATFWTISCYNGKLTTEVPLAEVSRLRDQRRRLQAKVALPSCRPSLSSLLR